MPRFSDTVGILGGTFDPPHLGHEFLVRELLERFRFRELWIIPAGQPYLNKSTTTPGAIRSDMAKAAFSSIDPRVKILDLEVVRATGSGKPSTSWETLNELRQKGISLTMCVGSDQWNQIKSWARYPEVLKLSNWAVFERQGHPLSRETHGLSLGNEIEFYETASPEVSSTQVREIIEKAGKIDMSLISQRVKDCLMKHHLYGT